MGDIAKDHGRHQEQPIVGPALLRCDGCGHIQRHCCFQQHSCRNIMHLGTTATHPLLKSVQALCFRDGQDRRARWVEHLRRCWPDSVSTFDQEEGAQACRVNQMSVYPFSLTPSKQCYFAEYVQKRAASRGGLSLGRKRQKGDAAISCYIAINGFKKAWFNGKGGCHVCLSFLSCPLTPSEKNFPAASLPPQSPPVILR